jgi:uncharacterized membrane protein
VKRSGALADVGINDNFIKELAATLQPGSSALFVLVRKASPDKVLEELRSTGGKMLKASLTHEKEEKLQAALDMIKMIAPPGRAAPIRENPSRTAR